MGHPAKRAAWLAVGFHVAALGLSAVVLEPVFQNELPKDPHLWGALQLAGWRICWIIWIAAVALFIRLLFLAERRPRLFVLTALFGWAFDAFHTAHAVTAGDALSFERWYPLYRIGSLGIANAFYASSVLGFSLRSLRNPAFPKWLGFLGVGVFCAAVPVSIAGFFGLTGWDDTVSIVFFALLLPWMLALAYGWIAPASAGAQPHSSS